MDFVEEEAVVDEVGKGGGEDDSEGHYLESSPACKRRSKSDGGGTPGKLSPSPLITETSRRTAKDDSSIGEASSLPVTPRRPEFPLRGLSLQMPQLSPARQASQLRPVPLSPKLDHSQIYASPTNILPRRSRGLDFSRAATSLHHSILAEQSSPDSSPTMGGRAMNIPKRSMGEFGPTETSNSLWSMMGSQEKMNMSTSLGSANNNALCSDSSASSDEDELMDEDMEEPYVTTPQLHKLGTPTGPHLPAPWPTASPAGNGLLSFQQRQRPRRQPRKKMRGPLGLGFSSILPSASNMLSKSPPTIIQKETPAPHSRRESISWAANQLHISGSESDDSPKLPPMENADGAPVLLGRDGQRGVVRRVVTRRGNLLPKTKGFARIRAALAEENAPVDSEFRREAEVIRQVRESDMDFEPRLQPPSLSTPTTAHSSPNLPMHDNIDEMCDDTVIMDPGLGPPSSFTKQAIRNSKGRNFWETFTDPATMSTTPPPPPFLPRGSSSGFSMDDMSMDSPSTAYSHTHTVFPAGTVFPMTTTTSSSGGDTPQPTMPTAPPTAAEITRRINNKRRRDDDFDPASFKRRAVSPGMSVHNSPIMQSPLQRDLAPWGSRPGSNGGDKAGGGGSGAPSENGSQGQGPNGGRINGGGRRIGFQGMVDTNDGITRLSIE